MVASLNSLRAANGLKPLSLNPLASFIAQGWAANMAKSHVLSHGDFEGRIANAFPGRVCGECVSKGQLTASQMVRGLANDPPHRAIVLDSSFTIVGVGVDPGYQAGDGPYWVIDFIG